jgi:hypothetical protein
MRPSELCRLLNSTPLGEVINERQLHRHRSRAGLRIGDGRHVDLLRYVAWLIQIRHAPRSEPVGDPYEALKERARARNAAIREYSAPTMGQRWSDLMAMVARRS